MREPRLTCLHFLRPTRQETYKFLCVFIINYGVISNRLILRRNSFYVPFDATVIPLMSQLFWRQGYRQVKLITTLNQDTQSTDHLILSPGQAHEILMQIL
jgi:hypothetical protein